MDRSARQTFDDDALFDLLRGVAAYTGSALVGDLARLVGTGAPPDLSIAFNHKQIGSKLWLRDALFETLPPRHDRVLIVGGWIGVLSAMLLDDPRFVIGSIGSLDLDPGCAPVAMLLNKRHGEAGRFYTVTADMYAFDVTGYDLVINTSCEHIPDLRTWLDRLSSGTKVVLQSNDYRREPEHISCVDSVDEFHKQARLEHVFFSGERPTQNYRRFMLIGST
jgi:hypothetical protein